MSALPVPVPPNLDTHEPEESLTSAPNHKAPGQDDAASAETQGQSTISEAHSVFTRQQKIAIATLVSVVSVLSPMSATIYVPALPTIAQDLDVSISLVNLSVTSYMIFQGLSPSVWGSLTDVLGRRPVYLGTMIIYIAACLGLAFTTNYAELIVFRCLQSTGSASTIAIGAGVIGDITQRRERGGYIGVYSAGALVGNAIGPILGGIFAQRIGWHGIFYFLTALAGLILLTLLVFLPETLRAKVGNGSIEPGSSFLSNPLIPILVPVEQKPSELVLSRRNIDLLGPLKMMAQKDVFCGLIFTAIYYTVWQCSVVASSTLFSRRYGLSEISVGLSFISSGVGAISASLLTGRLLNYDYRQSQKRVKARQTDDDLTRLDTSNIQVEHIEHARLKRLPIASLLFIGTALAFGWCIQAHTTIALPILWTFFTSFMTTAIMSMFSTLIVDWYPDAGASATAAINLARCLLGAGGISVVQPLINAIGVGWTFTLGAALCLLAAPLGALVYYKGETWRHEREHIREAQRRQSAVEMHADLHV